MFHFTMTVLITALVATFVIWRYRVAVLRGMSLASGEAVRPAARTTPRSAAAPAATGTELAALQWERQTHRRVIAAWLLTVAVPAPLIAAASMAGELLLRGVVMASCVIVGAAVPVIAVSLGWT